MFALAGYLKKTVGELCETMTSAEFSEWMAVHKYHQPLPDSWTQTGMIASAVVAPHCKRGKTPKPQDFIPRERLPQTPEEMQAEINKLIMAKGRRK